MVGKYSKFGNITYNFMKIVCGVLMRAKTKALYR